MKLNLPIFKNVASTFERWSSILRVTDFVVNNDDEEMIPFDSGAAPSSIYAMTVVKAQDTFCAYSKKLYPWIWVDMRITVTLGGVAAPIWFVKLPIPPKEYPGFAIEKGPGFACPLLDAGTPRVGWATVHNDSYTKSGDHVVIAKEGGAVFTLGDCRIFLSGWYRAQT